MGRSINYRSPSSVKRSRARLVDYLHKMIKATRRLTIKQIEANIMTRDTPETLPDQTNATRIYSGDSLENFDSFSFVTSTPVMSKVICMRCWKECIDKQHWKSRLKRKHDLATMLDISSVESGPLSGLQQVAV